MKAKAKTRAAMIAKKYKWLHDDLKARRGLSFNHGNSTLAGCRVIEAIYTEMPVPVGIIWYRHVGKSEIEILSCYVIDYGRRCGVASFLLDNLLAAFKGTTRVTSGDGTEYGKPWMISQGFVKQADGQWVKIIAPPEPKKAPCLKSKKSPP